MPNATIRHWLRSGARDPAMTSRVLGVFYLAGGLLVLLSLFLPRLDDADPGGLLGIAGTAAFVGSASLIWTKLRRAQEELEALAHHDPLTGLANLRLFETDVEREMARAKRQDWPLCLISIDIDDFKRYNDEYGHVAGDRLLKSAASAWTETLRAEDVIARLGGDEFAALLPNCPSAEAEQVVKRLRAATPLGRSCSSGIACWDGQESAEQWRERADLGMYEAKRRRTMPA